MILRRAGNGPRCSRSPDELVECPLIGPRTHDNEGSDVDGLGVQARGPPRLTCCTDGPSYPLWLGANVDEKRPRTEHVDRDFRFTLYGKPAYAALETVDVVAAQVSLKLSEQHLESARRRRFDPNQLQRRVAPPPNQTRDIYLTEASKAMRIATIQGGGRGKR